MDIILHPHSEEPLYKQIYRQIVLQIAHGKTRPGEALPSVRTAARFLGVAVVTVKTAYEELEKDGFVIALPAKGFFVSDAAPALCETNRAEAESACEKFLNVCKESGLDDVEILALVEEKLRR